MDELKKSLIIAAVAGVVGGFYTFVPPKTIKALSLTLGLGHNERVLLGIIGLIVLTVKFYKIVLLKTGRLHEEAQA
jgi:hypothetical protein